MAVNIVPLTTEAPQGQQLISPEELAYKKQLAAALSHRGRGQPIQHWTQGAAQIVDALAARKHRKEYLDAIKHNKGIQKQQTAEANGLFGQLLGGTSNSTPDVKADTGHKVASLTPPKTYTPQPPVDVIRDPEPQKKVEHSQPKIGMVKPVYGTKETIESGVSPAQKSSNLPPEQLPSHFMTRDMVSKQISQNLVNHYSGSPINSEAPAEPIRQEKPVVEKPVKVASLDPSSNFMKNLIQRESGGRNHAKNPRSSAYGQGQFVKGTWIDMMRRHKPELMQGKTVRQILALRANPELSQEMTMLYAQENAASLRKNGIPVNDANLYMAHFAGAGGANKILKANPKTPLHKLMTPGAMRANPQLKGRTAGWLRANVEQKFGTQNSFEAPQSTQVADSSGQLSNDTLRQMLNNPQTRGIAQKLILDQYQARLKGQQPIGQKAQSDIANTNSRTELNRLKAQKLENDLNNPQTRKLNSTELKALYEAQDELPNLVGAIENLERAVKLLPDTFSGLAPETRAYIGNVTGLGDENSKATAEYSEIMNQQAIQAMSQSLKGATTEFELQKFIDIIADTSKPHDVRSNAINRLLTAARRQLKVKQDRINELQGLPTQNQEIQVEDPLGIR